MDPISITKQPEPHTWHYLGLRLPVLLPQPSLEQPVGGQKGLRDGRTRSPLSVHVPA